MHVHVHVHVYGECKVTVVLSPLKSLIVPNAELIERQRERLEANGQEEVCMDNPVINVESATSFTCVETCPVMNGLTFQPSVESRTCYGTQSDVTIHFTCAYKF